MTQIDETKRKTGRKSILKKLLLIFLVLILIIITATAGLYIYSKTAKTTKDDVAAIVSTETMPAAERYTFDVSSSKMEMSVDKSDLWWLLKEVSGKDIVGELADNLGNSGLTLQSYGLDITKKGILISAELTYGDYLRFPMKLLMNTTLNNGTLTISPSKVYLGKISLPLEKFRFNKLTAGMGMGSNFSLDAYKYDIALTGWDLLPSLTNIYFKDERMVMVYNLDKTLFSNSVSAYSDKLAWYSDVCSDCIEVLSEYSRNGALSERFTKLVEKFNSSPDSFPGFIAETLAVSGKSTAKEYFEKNKLWLARFMPQITETKVNELHTSLYNQCAERAALLDGLMDTLQASYNSRSFAIGEGGFTYKSKPFDLQSYLGQNWDQYSGWLDASYFRPVLIDTVNAYSAKTPLLRTITTSTEYIDNADTLNKKFPIGFIAKMKDGSPVLKYCGVSIVENERTKLTNMTVVLDKAKYESMKSNPLVPVWRD